MCLCGIFVIKCYNFLEIIKFKSLLIIFLYKNKYNSIGNLYKFV